MGTLSKLAGTRMLPIVRFPEAKVPTLDVSAMPWAPLILLAYATAATSAPAQYSLSELAHPVVYRTV